MEPLVSFIVPVYNVEKYIERCIKSILNQSYKNFELILINDGSPDNSQKIIDKYKKKDSRIISIVKNNEGVSTARNCGLDIAKGEYILFIDSDDYIDSDYAAYFINAINKYDTDMVISYNYYDEYNRLSKTDDSLNAIDSSQATFDLYMGKTGVAVWNKAYKRDIIMKNNIRFNPDFWFAEGMTFNIEYFQKCKNITAGNKKVYHQTYNPQSAVRKFNIDSWYCGMRAMKYQLDFLDRNNKQIMCAWNYHYYQYYYSMLKGIYESNQKDKYSEDIKAFKKQLKKITSFALKLRLPVKTICKWTLITIFPNTFIKYCINREKKLYKHNY